MQLTVKHVITLKGVAGPCWTLTELHAAGEWNGLLADKQKKNTKEKNYLLE